MGGVEEISSSFLKVWTFKVKVCEREFFDSLKVWSVWKKALWVVESVKFEVCQREFFPLCKFQVKSQAYVIKDLQVIEGFSFQV